MGGRLAGAELRVDAGHLPEEVAGDGPGGDGRVGLHDVEHPL